MRESTKFAVIAVIGLALGATACGDDAEQITKPELIEQADAICQEVQDELDPVFEALWAEYDDLDWDDPEGQDTAFVALAETLAMAAPAMHDMADDLRDLGAPEGDQELIAQLLDDLDAAVDEFVAQADAAVAGDPAARAYFDGEGGDAAMDLVNRRARDYGLQVCGADD